MLVSIKVIVTLVELSCLRVDNGDRHVKIKGSLAFSIVSVWLALAPVDKINNGTSAPRNLRCIFLVENV